MNLKKTRTLFLALMLTGVMNVYAQGTLKDYQRAYQIKQLFGTQNVYYDEVNPHFIGKTHSFWYVRKTPEGNFYIVVNVDKKKRERLIDHKKLAACLSKETKQKINANYLSLSHLEVKESLKELSFEYAHKYWSYHIKKNDLKFLGDVKAKKPRKNWMVVDMEKDAAPVLSPNRTKKAYIREYNIFVKDLKTNKTKQISFDGTIGNYYSAYISWSPDSRFVAANKIKPAAKRYVYYIESSPKDQLQPKLHKQEYAKPGDELNFNHPCVFEISTAKTFIPSTALFAHQYLVTHPVWAADSKTITFEYNERGHKVYRVLEYSVETQKVRTLIEEKNDKYVGYPKNFRYDLTDSKKIIWKSERDNYAHLYLYDRATGKPLHQITKGKWYVRDIQKVDEEHQQIYFSANGVNSKEDPYFIHYYRIDFDGTHMICLTPDEGMHKAIFSKDMQYLVDIYSMVNKAPKAAVRNAQTGQEVLHLETADITKLKENGWHAPEPFCAKGRDGLTDIWGIIIRPTNFDPNKKYPIIEYIYQGPGDQYVPKTFISYNYNMNSLSELGFIVVMIDGMSTSFRSRSFEQICYKNLKDAGLPDHILWLKAAAKQYKYMDITRVGIFGASAGGQESLNAILLHPDFYKAAYSACGCHDNRMDKIWWNELWMGYPLDESYKTNSNVENAHLLTRPLMLVVGELDDNVDPSSSMQVANALIKANKDFEFIVIPGAHHTMGESYGEHKRYDFFVKNLMNVKPPKWDQIK